MSILNIKTNPANTAYKLKSQPFKQPQFKQQQGIGMVEVMVSLLLLSIAVLGFSAMQMTAIKSSESSMIRTRAMSVIRSGSEAMRSNPRAIVAYKNAVNNSIPAPDSGKEDLRNVAITDCLSHDASVPTICSLEKLATRDGLVTKQFAANNELKIGVHTCPGSGSGGMEKQCFIASWDKTKPIFSDTDTDACATETNGTYKAGASCFVMEAY